MNVRCHSGKLYLTLKYPPTMGSPGKNGENIPVSAILSSCFLLLCTGTERRKHKLTVGWGGPLPLLRPLQSNTHVAYD